MTERDYEKETHLDLCGIKTCREQTGMAVNGGDRWAVCFRHRKILPDGVVFVRQLSPP